MPNTRKKVIKTVYKDENDSEEETGDFSDSGSDAKISDVPSSEEEEDVSYVTSGDEFDEKSKKKQVKSKNSRPVKKAQFAKSFISKINKQASLTGENESTEVKVPLFSVKDLTEEDKLLPSVLNLSESDSSDDESPSTSQKKNYTTTSIPHSKDDDDVDTTNMEYRDVWSSNIQDDSEELAKKTFLELEQHKNKIEETKLSIQNYTAKLGKESDVKDLLALGEEVLPEESPIKKKPKVRRKKDDSDSEMEDWEEVKESKAIPQQGIQLVVDLPGAVCKKSKKLDIEMMMKRKMNRVKKEYQVYMHKVHVLCWLGHGNYVSRVLNDQDILTAVLALVPSKECYPGERVDMKYVEQITTWYKDKLNLKQDKNEDKFRPKAPPLKEILLAQIKSRVVTTKKYMVFIFVSMLRALGLQCRVMFNFVTLPIKPPVSELCSLSTKPKTESKTADNKTGTENKKATKSTKPSGSKTKPKGKVSQVDGADEAISSSDSEFDDIMQLDGNNDPVATKTRNTRSSKTKNPSNNENEEDVSPPKRVKKSPSPKPVKSKKIEVNNKDTAIDKNECNSSFFVKDEVSNLKKMSPKSLSLNRRSKVNNEQPTSNELSKDKSPVKSVSPRKTRSTQKNVASLGKDKKLPIADSKKTSNPPKIVVTDDKEANTSSKYFDDNATGDNKTLRLSRKRSHTANPNTSKNTNTTDNELKVVKPKTRTKSAPGSDKSKYFNDKEKIVDKAKPKRAPKISLEDVERVSHRDLLKKTKPKNDVTEVLVGIIKTRVKEAKFEAKQKLVKGKIKKESDEDNDYLPEEAPKPRKSESDEDFKPVKLSPKPGTSRKIDRRVLSSDTSDAETNQNKIDVWCEVFVEELEQWICIDVIKGQIHATKERYSRATHPVCYVVGWDNNNYLKDLTRRYVPHWNTVTRKQRAEPEWWEKAVRPWLGPKTARDKEEDEALDRMQLEAPLPKSIAEYKNHPLYALKRHLLKFEAIYPPDAATLGFIRSEPVYARDCVYTCRSRDTWLKEAKVVRLGETPYKVVKARPKWDKLSNKLITDKPLEVFGPWQVQDYEPPVAENGIVPRNAYGNVELFKDCMLPKGTVHIKLPGLNRVAKKLNIDCAPAMTGFDFNGGWSHPVYDGFVVCQEFEEVITEAWLKDQEEQERKEIEKMEARVYGNWKRLIKGLMIRERLKNKYGFEEPSTSQDKKKPKAPRLVVKKK